MPIKGVDITDLKISVFIDSCILCLCIHTYYKLKYYHSSHSVFEIDTPCSFIKQCVLHLSASIFHLRDLSKENFVPQQ